MEIVLYRNNSDEKVVTKDITTLATLYGHLKEGCSVIDPVILIEGFNPALVNQLNYVKISEFGRYYFVKNITNQGKLWEISLHVDVISSWQTQLKSLEAVIARQENDYNLYLQDGLFRTYQNPYISIIPFPDGFDSHHFIFSVSG